MTTTSMPNLGAATHPVTKPSAPRGRGAGATEGHVERRRRILTVALVLSVLALVASAALAVTAVQSSPERVGVGAPVTVGGLELTVVEFGRRVDAAAGVNSEQEPLSGPTMPMSMNGGSQGEAGATGSGSTMSSMPGMAGMLEHGQERVDVAVSLSNVDDEGAQLDPGAFWLVSGEEKVPLLQPTTSDLTDTALPPGFTTTGTLTFVIPQGATPLELRYSNDSERVVLEATPGSGDLHGGSHE